jgi:hypothetical protein
VNYKKPEILAVVNAASAIENTKPGPASDANHPNNPPQSAGAYMSDE